MKNDTGAWRQRSSRGRHWAGEQYGRRLDATHWLLLSHVMDSVVPFDAVWSVILFLLDNHLSIYYFS